MIPLRTELFQNYAWQTFHNNGWEWVQSDSVDFSKFKMKFLCTYTVTVYAVVSMKPEHLCNDGQYGVLWLDAEYENESPYSEEDLKNMLEGIHLAEKNLLLIGIPFTENYFSGKTVKSMVRKNASIRKKLKLEEQESRDSDY